MATLILDMVKLLLAEGAEVNSVARGHSPLSLAIVNSHSEVHTVICEYFVVKIFSDSLACAKIKCTKIHMQY